MQIRKAQGVVPSSSGTQDITVSGFGTVQACIVTVNAATSLDSVAAPYNISSGFYDGSNAYSMSAYAEDNVGTTNTDRSASNSNVVSLIEPSGGGSINRTATVAFITDGIRLTWDSGDCDGYEINVTLINGVKNVDAGIVSAPTAEDGTVSTTAPGFKPHMLLTLMPRQAFNNNVNTVILSSYGMAVRNSSDTIEQGCIWQRQDNAAASSAGYMLVSTERIGARSSTTESTYEVSSFDTNGWTIATRDATAGSTEPCAFLAIELYGTPELSIDAEASPTSTGNEDYTSAGFLPEAAFILSSQFLPANINTFRTDTRTGVLGLCGFTSNEGQSSCTYSKDGESTTDTGSYYDDSGVVSLDTTSGSREWRGDHSAWLSNGVTINYDDVDSSERLFLMLLVRDGYEADGAATLPQFTSSGVANQIFEADGAAELPALESSGTVDQIFEADGAAELPALECSGTAVSHGTSYKHWTDYEDDVYESPGFAGDETDPSY